MHLPVPNETDTTLPMTTEAALEEHPKDSTVTVAAPSADTHHAEDKVASSEENPAAAPTSSIREASSGEHDKIKSSESRSSSKARPPKMTSSRSNSNRDLTKRANSSRDLTKSPGRAKLSKSHSNRDFKDLTKSPGRKKSSSSSRARGEHTSSRGRGSREHRTAGDEKHKASGGGEGEKLVSKSRSGENGKKSEKDRSSSRARSSSDGHARSSSDGHARSSASAGHDRSASRSRGGGEGVDASSSEAERVERTAEIPKGSLSKDYKRRPNPTQLGNINPLMSKDDSGRSETVDNDNEKKGSTHTNTTMDISTADSLALSSLQNSTHGQRATSSASNRLRNSAGDGKHHTGDSVDPIISACSSTDISSSSLMGASSSNAHGRTIVILPHHSDTGRSNNTKILVANPDTILNQLLEALPDTEDGSNMARLLQQAMYQVLSTATQQGTPAVLQNGDADTATSTAVNGKTQELETKMTQLQDQLQTTQQQQEKFLLFQQEFLQQKQTQDQLWNQQQQQLALKEKELALKEKELELRERELELEQQRQKQLQQQQQKQQQRAFMEEKSPTSVIPEKNGKPQQQEEDKSLTTLGSADTKEMLDRMAAFEEMEATEEKTKINDYVSSANAKPSRSSILTNGDTIVTEYVDDDEYDDSIKSTEDDDDGFANDGDDELDNETPDVEAAVRPAVVPPPPPQVLPPQPKGLVEIWVCPNCNFEHEKTTLQFCGVCGTNKPAVRDTAIGNNNNNLPPAEEDRGYTSPVDTPASPQAGSPPAAKAVANPPAKDPMERWNEMERERKKETGKDMVPMTPGRRKKRVAGAKSASTEDAVQRGLATPKRTRPKVQRARTPTSSSRKKDPLKKSLNSTYHGHTSSMDEPPLVVKCVDGDGEVYDLDMLNQQLSTFESGPRMTAGTAPTMSAPKTPKVDKRQLFKRPSPQVDSDEEPIGYTSDIIIKPSIRQAIPRRAKSSSTEQLRLAQQQQNGAAPVPPSPSGGGKKGLFGAAVSGIYKSPKKAMSALKIAGKMPQSLLGGGGGGKNKGGGGFLLDSDDDDEDISDSDDGLGDDIGNKRVSSGRRMSLDTKSRESAAAAVAGKTSGWKKWFDNGDSAKKEEVPVVDDITVDIDDTARDMEIDDDIYDSGPSDVEEQRGRRRRNKSGDQLDGGRGSSHGAKRMGRRGSNGVDDLGGRGSSHGNRRRTSVERANRDSTNSPGPGRPQQKRDWNKRRSNAMQRQQSTRGMQNDLLAKGVEQLPDEPTFKVRKDIQQKWEKEDQVTELRNKAEQLKQRFQGLRKGTAQPAAAREKKEAPKGAPAVAGGSGGAVEHDPDMSEGTDGCTIYLEKSIGDMSEITSYL